MRRMGTKNSQWPTKFGHNSSAAAGVKEEGDRWSLLSLLICFFGFIPILNFLQLV